jgi:hypothetical protein
MRSCEGGDVEEDLCAEHGNCFSSLPSSAFTPSHDAQDLDHVRSERHDREQR